MIVEQLPVAYQSELVLISAVKSWLLGALPPADRLHMLEWLAGHNGPPITQAVVAAVPPADDITIEIVSEAIRLSISADDNGSAFFKVLEGVAGDLLRRLT